MEDTLIFSDQKKSPMEIPDEMITTLTINKVEYEGWWEECTDGTFLFNFTGLVYNKLFESVELRDVIFAMTTSRSIGEAPVRKTVGVRSLSDKEYVPTSTVPTSTIACTKITKIKM